MKIAAFQQPPEMSDSQVAGQQFSVKSRIPLLSAVQLHGEETERSLSKGTPLVKYSSHMCSTGIHFQRQLRSFLRVHQFRCIHHGRLAGGESSPHAVRPLQLALGSSLQYVGEWLENLSCPAKKTTIKIHHPEICLELLNSFRLWEFPDSLHPVSQRFDA